MNFYENELIVARLGVRNRENPRGHIFVNPKRESDTLIFVIEGEVENSIIFRGVHIGRGTVVKNCVLLQDTYVGEKAELNCVVTDKNVLIKDERHLSGHESMPFFIGKGISV